MIKRLKWNVLYGEAVEEDSDLSDASDDSYEGEAAAVQSALDELARNDPRLVSALGLRKEASYPNEESEIEAEDQVDAASTRSVRKEDPMVADKTEYAEWQECQLCPGKRFLNDAEVELHLASKRHARALRRATQTSLDEQGSRAQPVREGTSIESSPILEETKHISEDGDLGTAPTSDKIPIVQEVPFHAHPSLAKRSTAKCAKGRNMASHKEDEEDSTHSIIRDRRAEKKKAAVKRKLKALKRRKWEKERNGVSPRESLKLREEVQKCDGESDATSKVTELGRDIVSAVTEGGEEIGEPKRKKTRPTRDRKQTSNDPTKRRAPKRKAKR